MIYKCTCSGWDLARTGCGCGNARKERAAQKALGMKRSPVYPAFDVNKHIIIKDYTLLIVGDIIQSVDSTVPYEITGFNSSDEMVNLKINKGTFLALEAWTIRGGNWFKQRRWPIKNPVKVPMECD